VAFEYRNKNRTMRWLSVGWSFIGGSVAAAFIQGLTVGRWSKGCQYITANTRKFERSLFGLLLGQASHISGRRMSGSFCRDRS
jgi:cytochrome bd-type quinol oxidase subunit 2